MAAREIRIGFCENGAGYGGAVISLAAFLEKLPADFRPTIYTGIGTAPYQQLSRLGTWRHVKPKMLLKERWLRSARLPFRSTVDNLLTLLPTTLSYYYAFKRDRIDLVYLNNDASCNMAAALAAKLAGLPSVLHSRGFNADTRGCRWVLGNIRHCIAVSTAVRDGILRLGIGSDKCTVVHEGLDLTLFRPQAASSALRAELGIAENEPVITLVGGLVDWKGQDVLLEAAPAILQRYPNAHILLPGSAYGADNRYADMIAERARAPILKNRVRLLGARSDIPELLALSTIVLHASTQPEPFGRTFLEGMALGKPVIASNEGGPCDVIENGVDGLLIPPRDPALLSDAILKLLDAPALAASLGRRAADKARAFSIEHHTDAICTVLRTLSAA